MGKLKGLLLLGVLISAICGQSSASSGKVKSLNKKTEKPVVAIASMPDAAYKLKEWQNYKYKYHLRYNNTDEETKSRNFFLLNLEYIKNRTTRMAFRDNFKLAINKKFGTTDFRYKKSGCVSESILHSDWPCPIKELTLRPRNDQSLDWRSPPYRVGRVHDQGPCSSCWAFSAIAVLEGWFAYKNKRLVEFSPQQLIDCHFSPAKDSCRKDRRVPDAFKILQISKGLLATSERYTYKYKGGSCLINKSLSPDHSTLFNFTGKCARVDSRWSTANQKEKQLKEAVVRYGPVSVSINTDLKTFKFYKSGIYNDKDCASNSKPTHAVTVVGFGKDYWIIKNSWGTDWGDNGYMKLAMGNNLCGIANYGYFITEPDDHEGHVKPEKSKDGNKVGSGSSLLRGTIINVVTCLATLLASYSMCFLERNY